MFKVIAHTPRGDFEIEGEDHDFSSDKEFRKYWIDLFKEHDVVWLHDGNRTILFDDEVLKNTVIEVKTFNNNESED